MRSQKIREKFLKFFEERGHAVVPSSSLIPDDPSVLLTTAGMQQFKPYFMDKADAVRDFGSKNTVSIQKSFRTSDIDEVGDKTHLTFFEMLGNFSFGGYFKEDAIKYAYDFITKELNLDIDYVTVFEGDDITPKDNESERIWRQLGMKDIRFEGREDLFWGPTGSEGPCGPSTELYINDVEIWNIVFNEYYCLPAGDLPEGDKQDRAYKKLKTPGVDTGMGLERLATVMQKKDHVFETDLFTPIMEYLPKDLSEKVKRITADHIRAVSFLISDGVRPSNKEAGYILRRLMRRIITHQYLSGELFQFLPLFEKVVDVYGDFYKELELEVIQEVFEKEHKKFMGTLRHGIRELKKMDKIDATSAFHLYESYGLPYDVTKEMAADKAKDLSREQFEKELEKHKEASRAGADAKFGGHGLLLDTGELKARDAEEVKIVTRLHTATHLLQAALREVLGPKVKQAGSDITADRTRFDFTYDRKLTDEEVKKVEHWVNDKIGRKLDVKVEELSYDDAVKTGALYFEKEKYPQRVKVYSVLGENGKAVSKELCGGPHVKNTGGMGTFKILKQESVGAGMRRIKAVLTEAGIS